MLGETRMATKASEVNWITSRSHENLFSVCNLDENLDYKDILQRAWDFVQSQGACTYRNFSFHPGLNKVGHEVTGGLGPSQSPSFVISPPVLIDPPRDLAIALSKVMNSVGVFPTVVPEIVRLFLTDSDVPPHTDVPYRHGAVNLAISDAMGFTKSSLYFGNDANRFLSDPGFQYEYGKVYFVNTSQIHYVKSEFCVTSTRLVASASLMD
jgi:hypothetical protein